MVLTQLTEEGGGGVGVSFDCDRDNYSNSTQYDINYPLLEIEP